MYDQIQMVANGQSALASKLDTALITQTLGQQSTAQQLADIRHDMNDHEMRIRVQEARPYIAPKSMWTGISVIVGVLAVFFTIAQVVIK